MKKILSLLFATLLATSINAQTKGDLDGDGKITTNDITTLISKYVEAKQTEKEDTTLFHAFDGYILVSSAYFSDMYYGNDAKLCVYKTSKDEYIVTFSDPTWGEAFFGNVGVGRTLSGEGTIAMDNHKGGVTEYAATLSGPMTTPVITAPSVMGGTAITFHVGTAPQAYAAAGRWKGTNNVAVGTYTYTAEITYTIAANADGTINVTVPQYQLSATMMGDLDIGSYTISNVAYDEARGSFYRNYKDDGLTMHMTAVKDNVKTMDSDYTFANNDAIIEVKLTETGIEIINNYQPGSMPFPIETSLSGTKATGR